MRSLRPNPPAARFPALVLALVIGSYVPACCCWTQATFNWLTGLAADAGHGCHACADHYSEPDHPDAPAQPGHEQDCACGGQERVNQQITVRVPAPDAVVVAWLTPAAPAAIGEPVPAAPRTRSGPSLTGSRTLLRQHCALIV